MTTMTHTPTPWITTATSSGRYITTKDGIKAIASAWDDDGESAGRANAAHIVQCVNAYDSLVALAHAVQRDAFASMDTLSMARSALRDAGIAESGVAE